MGCDLRTYYVESVLWRIPCASPCARPSLFHKFWMTGQCLINASSLLLRGKNGKPAPPAQCIWHPSWCSVLPSLLGEDLVGEDFNIKMRGKAQTPDQSHRRRYLPPWPLCPVSSLICLRVVLVCVWHRASLQPLRDVPSDGGVSPVDISGG